ncbi:MAG: restriction endonuclease subunit S, partial [Anaerolineae bacterium]|nr:restriction endonuclease subunit S [Anaerolineae bacterium]
DVLYGKLRPYLDKAVLAEWEGMCATDILVFVIDKQRALPEFVVHLLHTRTFLDHAIATTSGTNHPRTSWQALQSFTFALPPLSEQRAIARILSAVDNKIAAEEKRKAALQTLFKTMLHNLMTGQIRVKDK